MHLIHQVTKGFVISQICLQFEDAAREVADEVTRPRPEGDEAVQDIQVMILSAANPISVRALKVYFNGRIEYIDIVRFLLCAKRNLVTSTL